MNLTIDIGNTLTKLSVIDNTNVLHSETVPEIDQAMLGNLLTLYPSLSRAIWVSVREKQHSAWLEFLQGRLTCVLELTHRLPLPIRITYKTPETMGMDRVAAVCGAHRLYPGKDVLVIDAGTAITYEFLSRKGEYLGGNISPGIAMRFRALHEFTARLPLVKESSSYSPAGKSTEEAIASGVLRGILAEVNEYVSTFYKNNPNGVVILTGGDAIFFGKKLKSTIFVNPNLIHVGLEAILDYNAEAH